jgi:hypothetical protein
MNSTHCKKGHRYTTATTYIHPLGWRHCKICRANSQRLRKERIRKAAIEHAVINEISTLADGQPEPRVHHIHGFRFAVDPGSTFDGGSAA